MMPVSRIAHLIIIFEMKCVCLLKPFELTICYDNSSTLTINNNKPQIIEVTIGSTVHLWCHYCNAEENLNPKLWFYQSRGKLFQNETNKEIQTNYDSTDSVSITLSHTLSLYYFNSTNSGIYTCKSYEKDKNLITEEVFTYVLDGIIYVEVSPKVGTLKQWQVFKRTYMDSINKKFYLSNEEPYNIVKNKYNIILNVYTMWDNWSDCKRIDSHQKGIRKRLGRCRIGPVTNTSKVILKNSSNAAISYLSDSYDVPCRSAILNELLPEISSIVKNIPDFETKEICSPSRKAGKHKIITNKSNMHKTTQQVMENSNVVLKCREVIPNSELKWFKDKTLLKSLYRNIINNRREDEPHISIDANNSLHILHITKKEEGNYTCSMNGKQIEQIEVKVVSKSILLNQEFIRYSIYLGFVLSLTMTCYCAGLCVAWHRRASFADPLNLYKKKTCDSLKCEQEKLIE